MKKMALLMVMVGVLGGLLVQPCFAQAWSLCTISGAGVANGNQLQLLITAADGSFAGTIHVYEPNSDADANRNLAVALTAMSLGSKAFIFTTGLAEGGFNKVVLSNQ